MVQALLLSNSTAPGQKYLSHAINALKARLKGIDSLAFVPYALKNHDEYTRQVEKLFLQIGVNVFGVHRDPQSLVESEAIFVGGGNTFRLLRELQERALVEQIQRRVLEGQIYIGSSAGTNIACPMISTTNDMPILEVHSFKALNLIPFQINPHYIDTPETPFHMGETREQRINQYLEENEGPVLGMREGTWLRIHEASVILEGVSAGARLFTQTGQTELAPGTDLSELMKPTI